MINWYSKWIYEPNTPEEKKGKDHNDLTNLQLSHYTIYSKLITIKTVE